MAEAIDINRKEWLDRKQILTIVLIAATAIAFYLCYLIARPFLASLAWALALAVLAFPLYKRIKSRIKNRNLASILATVLVAAMIVIPIVFIGQQVAREAWKSSENLRNSIQSGEWRTQLEQNRFMANALRWAEEEVNLRGMLEQAANQIPGLASGFLSGSVWFLFQLLITFFALFFFFRDHDSILRGVRRLVPLSHKEATEIFKRVSDTLYATIFGEILIASLQGMLGGLMFWILGLPAPFLWGFVMGLFGFLPLIGGWMIWLPAAIYLFTQDEWVKGFVLIGWGILALTLLTTFLYPILVGDRLRLHTLIVFIAIIGGIMAFGTTGIILGPLVFALTISAIDIWKKRMDRQEENSDVDTANAVA